MLPTVAPRAQRPQGHRADTAFPAVFTAHTRVSYFRVARAKTSPPQRVPAAQLRDYPFYTPPQSVGSALVVDIDRPEAVLEIFETIPVEIHPSWVVETRRGAQAGWLIDPVDLRATAREHPIRYARAVGLALRTALGGDEAVDPLTPTRIRNPAYSRAELRSPTTPPVFTLSTLHHALSAAGLWTSAPPSRTGRSPVASATATISAGTITEGGRNVAVFDAARHVAYTGGDHETAAWEAADRCNPPLPAAEVHNIIRSIDRYMSRGHATTRNGRTMSDQMRQLLSDMGRRGGRANTQAQRAARALGTAASVAARKDATDKKARQAQRMAARGHTRRQIAQKLCASAATICRWMRRYVTHQAPRFINGASGDPNPRGRHRQVYLPRFCTYQLPGRSSCSGGSTENAEDPP